MGSDTVPCLAVPVRSDPHPPFILGGHIRWRPERSSLRQLFAVGVMLLFVMLPVRGLYRATGSSMEEAFMLVFPRLVQQGKVPNADFLHLYGPTSLDVLAGWYWVAGYTLEAERTFGLIQHLLIIFALYAVGRAWSYATALGMGMVAALLIMTPIGLSALAWHGGIGLALWSIVFAIRACHTSHRSDWILAGVLAGLALGFRPDLIIGLGITAVFIMWRRRNAWRPFLIGSGIGLVPVIVHIVRAGPVTAFRGMLLDPVVYLRPGRELPRPPSWGHIDGALQAVAEGSPPWWGFPALSANHQLWLWFWAVIIIAIAIPVAAWWIHRKQIASPSKSTILMAVGLFGLGILPQALQRPDSTHLAWVAVVSWSMLVPILVSVIHGRPLHRAALATLVVGALMFVVCPFYTYRHYLLHMRVGAGDLPLPFLVQREGRNFWYGDGAVADAFNQMIPDLEALSEPGDKIIVGPADLSRTIYSDVSVYFMFPELEPATYYIEMDPGLADRDGSGLAEEIPHADFMVLTNIWTGWNEPNASSEHLSDAANLAVANNMCLIRRYHDNLVLLYQRCDGGDGNDPSQVTGTYPLPGETEQS